MTKPKVTKQPKASPHLIEIRRLLRQQAAIATFGSFALREADLKAILDEATRVCAEGLDVPFCKICRYRPEQDDLFVEAGVGWKGGVVGTVISKADISSPQGRAFITGHPSICDNLLADTHFKLASFYAEYGIISTIDVIIKGTTRPYGVLEVDSDKPRKYDQHDINFLTAFANVVAEAVQKADRADLLSETLKQKETLIAEKDNLLEQRKVLVQELEHRVRNNLQLIYGMLNQQLREFPDANEQRGIRAVARRVSTLASVYNNLSGGEMTDKSDFGKFAKTLCHDIAEFQKDPEKSITLVCEGEELLLSLDLITILGIILTELVTNAYDHAFPEGKGAISVRVKNSGTEPAMGILTVRDDGKGFDASKETKRHGINLLKRLVQQLKGTFEVDTSKGSLWTITFPIAL